MTHFGLNPSFCDPYSRLPLFADPIRRGRIFEVFTEDGRPTKEPSPLGPDGWPIADGRWHGVRAFGDMGGTVPKMRVDSARVKQTPDSVNVWWNDAQPGTPWLPDSSGQWHRPSLQALRAFSPAVLRTLDWQRTNERPDWSKPRVTPDSPLQGNGMAVELQARAAELLGSHLWWCAPPRFELSNQDYEDRLEEMLRAIKANVTRPPVLEYGNELWNAGFSVHGWLEQRASQAIMEPGKRATWHDAAALEIATLKRVADRVFGGPGLLGQRGYYLFVGGQLTVPSHLDRVLSALSAAWKITPDIAGPALYVTPLKASKEEWEATGDVPDQEDLRRSMFARLEEIHDGTPLSDPVDDRHVGVLEKHVEIARAGYGVPYFACYEVGQSLIAGAHPWRKAALEAQTTEWMGGLYRAIRKTLESAGVDLACWYSAASNQKPTDPRVDVFGLLESTDLDPAKLLPKALAAMGK